MSFDDNLTNFAGSSTHSGVRNFILEQKAAGKPFFVYWAMQIAHKQNGYQPVPILDSNGNVIGKEARGTYKRNLEFLDYLFAQYRDFLVQEGLDQDTITFAMADNSRYAKGNTAPHESGTRGMSSTLT